MKLREYFKKHESSTEFAKRTGWAVSSLYYWANNEPPLTVALKIQRETKGKVKLIDLARESRSPHP